MTIQNVPSRSVPLTVTPRSTLSANSPPAPLQPGSGTGAPGKSTLDSRYRDSFEAAPRSRAPARGELVAQARPMRLPPRPGGSLVPSRQPPSFDKNPPGINSNPPVGLLGRLQGSLRKMVGSMEPPKLPAEVYHQKPDFSSTGAREQFEKLHEQIFKDTQELTDPTDRNLSVAATHQFLDKSSGGLKAMNRACTPDNPQGEADAAIISQELAKAAGVPGMRREWLTNVPSEGPDPRPRRYDPLAGEVIPWNFPNPVLVTGKENLARVSAYLNQE